MRIQDIMTTEVRTIGADATLPEALALMTAEHIHHLVVVDGRAVLGVVSARDLKGAQPDARRRRVGELMSAPCVTAPPDMLVKQAANLLRGRAIGSLPVVENKKLVGIITVSDLLELIGRGLNPGGNNRIDHAPHKKITRRNRAAYA